MRTFGNISNKELLKSLVAIVHMDHNDAASAIASLVKHGAVAAIGPWVVSWAIFGLSFMLLWQSIAIFLSPPAVAPVILVNGTQFTPPHDKSMEEMVKVMGGGKVSMRTENNGQVIIRGDEARDYLLWRQVISVIAAAWSDVHWGVNDFCIGSECSSGMSIIMAGTKITLH